MDRRRPAAVLGAVCVSVALLGAPGVDAQPLGPNPRATLEELPALSELPPLPSGDGHTSEDDEAGDSDFGIGGMSGVQTAALALAGTAFVAGGIGLALVTRRGRGDDDGAARDDDGAARHEAGDR